jgi:zinc and cadmium transporter
MQILALSTFPKAILATTLVQVIALAAVWTLKGRDPLLRKYLGSLVSLAVGVLLATALLHLLPEAIAHLGNIPLVWLALTATLIGLFGTERVFSALTGGSAEPAGANTLSTHEHHHGHHTSRPLNLVFGGMLHSFVDGVSVAAAFTVGTRVGLVTALAIMLHEVPHRLGDFALFVHLNVSTRRAMQLAILVGLPSLLGVALVTVIGAGAEQATAWLLPISAGSFLYIAMANLMPELQHECKLRRVFTQITCVVAGAVLVLLIARLPGA